MDPSSVIRRSMTTIAKRSRAARRRAPFIVTIFLGLLCWGLIALAWFLIRA